MTLLIVVTLISIIFLIIGFLEIKLPFIKKPSQNNFTDSSWDDFKEEDLDRLLSDIKHKTNLNTRFLNTSLKDAIKPQWEKISLN